MWMRNDPLRWLVLDALFIALVTAATMVIQVPMPGTQGYVNVGDTLIFAAALLLGPRTGFLAGSFGSALADLLTGYTLWAPWTFVIKGIEGLVAAWIGHRSFEATGRIGLPTLIAVVAAALWMVFGYYVAGGFLYGWAAAIQSVPGNLIQGGASIVFSVPLVIALRSALGTGRTGSRRESA